MKMGTQSWIFTNRPTIIGAAAIGGPREARGPLANDFDLLHDDLLFGEKTFEKAERKLLEEACELAIQKANLQKQDIELFLGGDLSNQIISSTFTGRSLSVPYLGLFGACSTSMQSLALAALIVDSRFGNNVLCGTASHYAAVEKQYRYPTEYGSQKPDTAQWTVTGAGAVVLGQTGAGPQVVSATIGRVVDMGLKDPFNMGAAMAPAAVDTLQAHFQDLQASPDDYDLIATGDLGRYGHQLTLDLFPKYHINMPEKKYVDCGMMIYDQNQPMRFAGGSGSACSAAVAYGHILNRMHRGELKKVLILATGALLSPLSYQQKESIPCVAHAVAIEYTVEE
ncbi:MAG: stage V sporulation protein AD [Firmicutes bacterium]|jgi:stage V sporulation protein AD|nr:stage V sporulation protein AD [Bacillota bacterium]NLL87390.1 stage V sporulation protein AD [Bacillota bacterium]